MRQLVTSPRMLPGKLVWSLTLLLEILLTHVATTQTDADVISKAANATKVGRGIANSNDYLTAYACEGSWLNVDCGSVDSTLHLDIIRANFGRFSISVCNDHGNSEWSVNCMSPRTLRVIEKQCDNRESCQLEVSSKLFGDPCPGTHKYVEVHYVCRKGPTSDTSPRPRRPPHWFPMPTTSKTTETTTTSSTLARRKSNGTEESDEVDSFTSHGVTPRVIEVRVPKPVNFRPSRRQLANIHLATPTSMERKNHSQIIPSDKEMKEHQPLWTSTHTEMNITANFCPPTNARGLFWNWTRSNQPAVQPCPSGSSGLARWACGPEGEWSVQLPPSLADCHSVWLADLDASLQRAYAASEAVNVSSSLAYFSNVELMHGGDLLVATRMLNRMVKAMAYHVQRGVVQSEESRVTQLVQNVVRSASNLLDRGNDRGWKDLSQSSARLAAADILRAVAEAANLLAEVVQQEKIIVKPTDNILLSVRVLSRSSLVRQSFPGVESLDAFSSTHGNRLELDSHALLKATQSRDQVRLYFTAFNAIERLLSVDSPELIVNARVVSIGVDLAKKHSFSFEEAPLLISFRHLRRLNVTRPQCVKWDVSVSAWRTPNCRTLHSNLTHTLCACRVLNGHFGLLMSEGGQEKTDINSALTSSTTSSSSSSMATLNITYRHVSAMVAVAAAVVCLSILLFFAIALLRRRSQILDSCLFVSSKELKESEKNGNRGNFYTVTPKLGGAAEVNEETGGTTESRGPPDTIEAQQQFFEHMIQLQKNPQQDTLVSRRSQRQLQQSSGDVEPSRIRSSNRASLANFNHHIYMEIDSTDCYEPLSSETYVMSTLSDSSMGHTINRFRTSSSSRESRRPLINNNTLDGMGNRSSLLQTISGVLQDHGGGSNINTLMDPVYPRMAARRSLMLHPAVHTHQQVMASQTLGRAQLSRENPQLVRQQQHVPQHVQQTQHVPQHVQQTQHVPQHVPQQQHVPQHVPQQQHVPQHVQQQQVPQLVQQQQHVPQQHVQQHVQQPQFAAPLR